jgi:hypothetical protein
MCHKELERLEEIKKAAEVESTRPVAGPFYSFLKK